MPVSRLRITSRALAGRGPPAVGSVGGRPRASFTGPPGSGRRTKRLIPRVGPADIAILDHENIDRVCAEDLVATGVRHVVNCSRSTSGSLSQPGSADHGRGGRPPDRHARERRCSTRSVTVRRSPSGVPRSSAARSGSRTERSRIWPTARTRLRGQPSHHRRVTRGVRRQHDDARRSRSATCSRARSTCPISTPICVIGR